MNGLRVVFLFLLVCTYTTAFGQEEQLSEAQQEYVAWAQATWDSLSPQTGSIKLSNGVATLDVPDNFYYLDPADSEVVLVDVWGNPPGAGDQTLGMLFPAEYTPFDEASWAVTVEYMEDGFVKDEDANDIDYAEMLAQMQASTNAANEERIANGYESITLIGWAAPPYYDQQAHKLHWARELRFGDQQPHTLNYGIRVLGRNGVLVLNFIAAMDQKELIDSQLDSVLAIAEFDEGFTYADFDPDIDKVAAYGISALIAGKVAAKTGLLAAAIVFLKKFGILIVIGIGVLFKKFFKRGKTTEAT